MKKKISFLLAILAVLMVSSCGVIPKSAPVPKQKVTGVSTVLLYHPDKVYLTGTDQKIYYLYFSMENESLFISDNTEMYEEISEWLPTERKVDHHVIIQGSPIDPFTIFEKGQLEAVAEKRGLKLNSYTVNWIFNISKEVGLPINNGRTRTTIQSPTERQKQSPTIKKSTSPWDL